MKLSFITIKSLVIGSKHLVRYNFLCGGPFGVGLDSKLPSIADKHGEVTWILDILKL